jgi:hypothetical protein
LHNDLHVYSIVLTLLLVLALGDPVAKEVDAEALLRRCAKNEIAALEHPGLFRYHERVDASWGSETRDVIETTEGRADRIIAYGDKPLTPEQNRAQYRRLQKLLTNSDALRDELKEQKEETERRLKMARALPDAVLLKSAGIESDGQLQFDFVPNPAFSPKNRETQIYRGMRGLLWIDPRQERISHVKGELFKDVSFGWGLVGKLHKGGRYEAAQTQMAPGIWRITTLDVEFHGSAFVFGRINIVRKETSTNFVPTPPGMTLKAAIEQLMEAHPSGLPVAPR